MPKGIIICTSSNVYQVAEGEKVYKCLARGKFRKARRSNRANSSSQKRTKKT